VKGELFHSEGAKDAKEREGATQSDVTSEIVLVLVLVLFPLYLYLSPRPFLTKEKEKEKE
jgi:hypothetical protein